MEQTVVPRRFGRGVNVEHMKLWVDALLSDKYEQGQGRLAYRDRNVETGELGPRRFCCLGLVSEIAIANGVDVNVTQDSGRMRVNYDYNGERDFLGLEVMKWLGVDKANPVLVVDLPNGESALRTASCLNDGEANDGGFATVLPPFTFRQIALALIRTYELPGYEHLLEEDDAPTD